MIQEVKFKGLSHSPSDNESQDGDLGTCLNLINEDGALIPISQPEVAESFTLPNNTCSIKYVHKVTHDNETHSHYIVNCTNGSPCSWYWTEKGGSGVQNRIDLGNFKVNAVTAVGNILCFIGDNKTIYAYWKDGIYKIIDFSDITYSGFITKVSEEKQYDVIEPNDTFNKLDNHISDSDKYLKFMDSMDAESAHNLFSAKDAYLNKKMDEETFKYIQFGVIAIKLYDGSYIHIGNPFTITRGEGVNRDIYLYYPNSGWTSKVDGEGVPFKAQAKTVYAVHLGQTLFKYSLSVSIPNLANFKDIISGVDVFVSNSIYPYKTNIAINNTQTAAVAGEGETQAITINTEEYGNLILRTSYVVATVECLGHWEYPLMSKDEFYEEISKLSFYKSISFSYDDILNGKVKNLKRIYQTEQTLNLSDFNRASYGATVAMTYNNRLHLANVSTSYSYVLNGLVSSFDQKAVVIAHVKFNYNGQTIETYDIKTISYPLDPLVSFPNDNVILFELYISKPNGPYKHLVLPIYNESNFGISYYAFYMFGKLTYNDFYSGDTLTSDEWDAVYQKAKTFQNTINRTSSLIKVSEAENPLVFPAKNSVQVGSATIKALAANTRPISEGQFGEAPLYAFTDEGVWVLMLGSEGTYMARQPVNRDICTNVDGILQIDDAVLYPTDRGIMMQQGRSSVCISDELDGYPFDFTQMPSASKVLNVGSVQAQDIRYTRFRNFLENSNMIYDYYDNRIIVFNPSYSYAYVYSLNSKMWGTMESDFSKRVNIYPESYAINESNQIVNVYAKNPAGDVPYFVCTRPLSLQATNIHKTMLSTITRGYFRSLPSGKCGMVLYGSNDLFKWYLVSSSVNQYLRGMAGTPYKYFRVALIGKLGVNETLEGLSADFIERMNNKLR